MWLGRWQGSGRTTSSTSCWLAVMTVSEEKHCSFGWGMGCQVERVTKSDAAEDGNDLFDFFLVATVYNLF